MLIYKYIYLHNSKYIIANIYIYLQRRYTGMMNYLFINIYIFTNKVHRNDELEVRVDPHRG